MSIARFARSSNIWCDTFAGKSQPRQVTVATNVTHGGKNICEHTVVPLFRVRFYSAYILNKMMLIWEKQRLGILIKLIQSQEDCRLTVSSYKKQFQLSHWHSGVRFQVIPEKWNTDEISSACLEAFRQVNCSLTRGSCAGVSGAQMLLISKQNTRTMISLTCKQTWVSSQVVCLGAVVWLKQVLSVYVWSAGGHLTEIWSPLAC